MLKDEDFLAAQRALKAKGQAALTKEERKQRQRALDSLGIPPFYEFVRKHTKPVEAPPGAAKSTMLGLRRRPTETLQLNIGLYCNQVGI